MLWLEMRERPGLSGSPDIAMKPQAPFQEAETRQCGSLRPRLGGRIKKGASKHAAHGICGSALICSAVRSASDLQSPM